MSGDELASIGQTLREERIAQGLTLEDAAARLRLMQRQIEAMETDDFESLGQPVFARGFVRNYARLLGLAPETLLAHMEGAPAEPVVVQHPEPPMPHSWLTSPWLILLLLGILLVAAVPVALYWWLNGGAADEITSPEPPVTRSRPAFVAEPASIVELKESATPTVQAVAVPSAVPVTETPASVDAVVSVTPEIPASSRMLHLEFNEEAWVEIKDASGRMLHRQLNRPGSSINVAGQPPFDLLVGNATQVSVTYNGRPIDLKPYIDVTVARFTLEE